MSDRIFFNKLVGLERYQDMSIARYSRQLFPLVLGNSRTILAANSRPRRALLSTTPTLGKQELDIKLDENPFYTKYAEKIKKLKETNPEEYYKRLDAIKKASEKPKQTETEPSSADIASDNPKSGFSSTETSSDEKRKGLDSILKLELLEDKLPSEITELWKAYYSNKDAVFAVIPADTYKNLAPLRKSNPIFIYPVPRKDGYEMLLGQFSGDDCLFTSLIQYQKHQENAPVQLVINHYTELQDSKGIVLMSGNVTDDNSISVTDAQLLSYQMQYFYSEENYQMVKDFNESPNTFDYNRIIDCMSKQLLAQQSGAK